MQFGKEGSGLLPIRFDFKQDRLMEKYSQRGLHPVFQILEEQFCVLHARSRFLGRLPVVTNSTAFVFKWKSVLGRYKVGVQV